MIRDILLLQQRELEMKLKEGYIDRGIDVKKFSSSLVKVIDGPRRAGKSFFAVHALHQLGTFGYANFDDERLVEMEDYDELISTINSLYNNPKNLLFDEIQNLPKWELFVNRLHRQGYNVILTGSNSRLLSKELATHLTGRHTLIHILPFSFNEFLKLEKKELTTSEIKEKLVSYLTHGGYPEPLARHLDTRDYLSTLFNSTIYKDIVKRFNIRSVQGIEDLAVYLISNVSKEYSCNALTKVTRCKSAHTIEKYIGYLEEAFIFFRLNRFSYKVKEQISSNKKIYCIDNGFIHAKAFKFSADMGKLYENVIAIALKKMEMNGFMSVYYWKNQQQEEVDFVIKRGSAIKQLIQVCYDVGDVKTREREVRALIKASEELRCNNLAVITESKESKETVEWFGTRRTITFIPLWKWLLENS